MIYLIDTIRTDCLARREELYNKMLANQGRLDNTDFAKITIIRNAIASNLGLNSGSYYDATSKMTCYYFFLDMKCRIVFTWEEFRSGIKNLHNHGI